MYTGMLRDDANWIKNPMVFKVIKNGEFSTYKQIIEYSLGSDLNSGVAGEGTVPEAIQSYLDDTSVSPVYYTKQICRDTTLGGSEVINPLYQFNELDDPFHPLTRTAFGNSGEGRMYRECIANNQQILYLTFGVPKFNSIISFYTKAINGQLADLMNKGASASTSIGYVLGAIGQSFLSLPFLPIIFLNRWLDGMKRAPATKYYDLQTEMPLYFKCVNTMVNHIAVNVGLMSAKSWVDKLNTSSTVGSSQTTGSLTQDLSESELLIKTASEANGQQISALPEIFDSNGFDIRRVLFRKYLYEDGEDKIKESSNRSTDAFLQDVIAARRANTKIGQATTGTANVNTDELSVVDTLLNGIFNSMYDTDLYIGVRIEKGVDCTETFSNQTGESEIAQTINSHASKMRSTKFNLMNGNIDSGVLGGLIQGAMNATSTLFNAGANALGMDSVKNVLTGNGIVDIPEVWTGSSFSKSYQFNVALRAPYGATATIMQAIYVPLSCIFAGAAPRAVGRSAYTSPFLCRAYSKGLFSVALGMITDLSVKRGGDQYGWSYSRLPTRVDLSFQIKDLSPALYMCIGDSTEEVADTLGANSAFQEYLLTLSGMGLKERLAFWPKMYRKLSALTNIFSTTIGSPYYWGAELGNSWPAAMIGKFVPISRIPNS